MSVDQLPDAERAVVPERKIVDYLLSPSHPDGRGKARFFRGFGFSAAQWQVLAAALRRHAVENSVTMQSTTAFGTRYVVEGILHTPDGRTPTVCVVWFVDNGDGVPRLVTAFPGKRR